MAKSRALDVDTPRTWSVTQVREYMTLQHPPDCEQFVINAFGWTEIQLRQALSVARRVLQTYATHDRKPSFRDVLKDHALYTTMVRAMIAIDGPLFLPAHLNLTPVPACRWLHPSLLSVLNGDKNLTLYHIFFKVARMPPRSKRTGNDLNGRRSARIAARTQPAIRAPPPSHESRSLSSTTLRPTADGNMQHNAINQTCLPTIAALQWPDINDSLSHCLIKVAQISSSTATDSLRLVIKTISLYRYFKSGYTVNWRHLRRQLQFNKKHRLYYIIPATTGSVTMGSGAIRRIRSIRQLEPAVRHLYGSAQRLGTCYIELFSATSSEHLTQLPAEYQAPSNHPNLDICFV